MALANKSPHVGGFSAFVVDQTPAGGFCNGCDFIPQPEIFKLQKKKYITNFTRKKILFYLLFVLHLPRWQRLSYTVKPILKLLLNAPSNVIFCTTFVR